MSKINKTVEIVTSTTKSLSSMSSKSRQDAKAILEKRYSDVRITDVKTADDLGRVLARRPDLVFLGMKFVRDETKPEPKFLWLSEEFSKAGIAFTGSGGTASMLENNKLLAKQKILENGLKTVSSNLIGVGQAYSENDVTIPYPIFIKPVDGGGGSGINEHSLVHNFDELKAQVNWLRNHCQTDALLETYLPGREFSVGILKRRFTGGYHLLPLEIVAPENRSGGRFLSSRIKSQDTERTLEVTDPDIRHKINALALDAFKALGAKDYGRVDIRLDGNGEPHFMEANLLPSLLKNYGNLPKAALLNIGLTHENLIYKITDLGLTKNLVAIPSGTTRLSTRSISPAASVA